MEKHKGMKSTFGVIVLIALLGVLFIWIFYGKEQEESYEISVIAGAADPERWSVLQRGLENAANDYQLQLNFYTISETKNVEEQVDIITRELEKQVDAIILDTVDSNRLMQVIQKRNRNTLIILIESDLEPGFLYPQITPDNYQIGVALGEMLGEDNQKTIGIVMENDRTTAEKERLKGLRDTVEKQKMKVEWIVPNQNRPAEASWYYANTDVDAIVALDTLSTTEAVSIVQGGNAQTKIYGVGNTESNIYQLDKEVIRALVIPNEYNMGYLSVDTAVKKITGKGIEDLTLVDHIIVTKDNLYDEEEQRIVFPFVQ